MYSNAAAYDTSHILQKKKSLESRISNRDLEINSLAAVLPAIVPRKTGPSLIRVFKLKTGGRGHKL